MARRANVDGLLNVCGICVVMKKAPRELQQLRKVSLDPILGVGH